jgi:hypothetical protein
MAFIETLIRPASPPHPDRHRFPGFGFIRISAFHARSFYTLPKAPWREARAETRILAATVGDG